MRWLLRDRLTLPVKSRMYRRVRVAAAGHVRHARFFTYYWKSTQLAYTICLWSPGTSPSAARTSASTIDLADLESVFDFPMISVEDDREAYGELRLQSLGMWRGRVVFLVWTPREDNSAHLISCRYADRQQTEVYFSSL